MWGDEVDESTVGGTQAEARAEDSGPTGLARMYQRRPGVDQGAGEILLQPPLDASVLEQLDEQAQCAQGTSLLDQFCNHDVVNSAAGFLHWGTSPPQLLPRVATTLVVG